MSGKRIEGKSKSRAGAKAGKTRVKKSVKDLNAKDARNVRGGATSFSEFKFVHQTDKSSP